MQPASSSNTPVGSNSSASAEERDVAANNSPQRNRRWMATGHGVQQIPEMSPVLIPPQHQEQPTLSPVEQRLVAEHQSAATASFVGAESMETDCPNPAAAFAEASAAVEPLAIEAGPAAEEIPLEDIVTNFLPSQQQESETGPSQTAAVVTAATQPPSSSGALAAAADASPTVSPSQILPASLDIAIDMALDTMARDVALEGLEHFPVLGSAELDMLEPLRDQMTYSQLMNVMTKIDLQSVEQATVLTWQQTFENRRRDPLDLNLDEFLDSLLEGADD